MRTADNDGVECYYETAGSGETVAFVPDVGFGAWLWGWQHRAVAGPYEALVMDLRGTGRSDRPEGPYSTRELADDLDAVLSSHGVRRVHLVGAGLGGMVALTHALRSDRVRSLSLFATAATGAAIDEEALAGARAPLDDPRALEDSLEPVLSSGFRRENPDVVSGIAEWRADDDAAPEAAAWQAEGALSFDLTDRLHEVTVPALVVHGDDDRVIPAERGRALADGLPRGRFEAFDGAGHLVFVERSRPINDLLLGFLAEHGSDQG